MAKKKSSHRKRTSNYSRRSLRTLSKSQRATRTHALSVLKSLRHSQGLKSLSTLSKENRISLSALRKHLGSNIYKKGGKWFAKAHDRIERRLRIYENGLETFVTIRNSKTSSQIGRYMSAVSFAREHGKKRLNFKELRFVDAKGNVHYLESSLSKINLIEDSRPKKIHFELYYEG